MSNKWRKDALITAVITFAVTLVVCLIIQYFLSAPSTGAELGAGFVIPVLATAIIICAIQIPLKRSAAKKGKYTEIAPNSQQAAYAIVGDSVVLFTIYIVIATTVIVGLALAGVFTVYLGGVEFPFVPTLVINSCVTAFAALFSMYHCSIWLVDHYQRKFGVEASEAA